MPNYNASLFYQDDDGDKTFDKAYSDISDIDWMVIIKSII